MIADFSSADRAFFGSTEVVAAYANGIKLWPAGAAGYMPKLVDNGGTGRLSWGNIGSDSKYLTLAMLLNPVSVANTVNGVFQIGRTTVNVQADNIEFTVFNNAATLLIELNSSNILTAGVLHQLVIICNTASGSEAASMYLDGVEVATGIPTAGSIDHTRTGNGIISGANFSQLGDVFIDLATPGLTISDFWDGAPRDVSLVGAPGLLFNGNASDWAAGTNFGNLTPTISVSGTFIDA